MVWLQGVRPGVLGTGVFGVDEGVSAAVSRGVWINVWLRTSVGVSVGIWGAPTNLDKVSRKH